MNIGKGNQAIEFVIAVVASAKDMEIEIDFGGG